MRRTIRNGLGILVALALGFPSYAEAEERRSPLADAPAIRRRVELRDKRFELGAGLGSSVGQDYYHAVLLNARLGFHLSDWLAIAGTFGHNLTPTFKTAFNEKLLDRLPDSKQAGDRAPTKSEALAGMNRIGQMAALQAELVPFTGKFSLFSKLFFNYDFYAFGGPGFLNFTADQVCPAGAAQASCAVTGWKVGANFGVGMHWFVNDLFALNFELRDILVRNNPAGRDENGDGVADTHDHSWDSNYMFTLNLMFFLPSKASVSH